MRFMFGNCTLDSALRELCRGGQPIHVEPQVFDLLLHLIKYRDRVVTKDDVLSAVWQGRIVSESTLSSRINAARCAIGDSGEQQQFIRTVARRGLRFIGEVTQELADMENAGAAANSVGRLAELHGKPTVAVLPFANISGDPEQEYFADGIAEDIITALAKHRSLLVITRNSTFAFKEYGADARRVGVDLGADYIVEGSVRKIGLRMRITAQLVETEGGRYVWVERYDRDLDYIFEVQDEIAATIAARIEPEVGTVERRRAERKPPQAFRAWDFFHLGTNHLFKATAADNLEAQRLFRSAIELDSTLAGAYAYLSYAIVLGMVYFDADPDDERLNEALTLAKKGIELDDKDALIRFMYGRALLAGRAYEDALAELTSAVELNPCLAVVYCGLGDSLAYEGRFGEAIPYFQKAIDLSPYDPQRWAFYSYRALAHLFARQFDQAYDWAQKATRIPGCHYWPFAHRVCALGHLQRVEGLQSAKMELLRRKPSFSRSFARGRLFFVKDPMHLDIYVDGLRKAGIPD